MTWNGSAASISGVGSTGPFSTWAPARSSGFAGGFNWGDQINFFSVHPVPGKVHRRQGDDLLEAVLSPPVEHQHANLSRLVDPRTDAEVFDVKIFRMETTYQFTERLLLRNIMEYNTFDRRLDANLLVTYRVNSGTVFYVGYDDHYEQGNRIDPLLFPIDEFRQTNRAFFTKFSYLFRY